jgi:hypothetical protein
MPDIVVLLSASRFLPYPSPSHCITHPSIAVYASPPTAPTAAGLLQLYLSASPPSSTETCSSVLGKLLVAQLTNICLLLIPKVHYRLKKSPQFLGMNLTENTVLLLLRSCPLPRERVYRAVAQKRVA